MISPSGTNPTSARALATRFLAVSSSQGSGRALPSLRYSSTQMRRQSLAICMASWKSSPQESNSGKSGLNRENFPPSGIKAIRYFMIPQCWRGGSSSDEVVGLSVSPGDGLESRFALVCPGSNRLALILSLASSSTLDPPAHASQRKSRPNEFGGRGFCPPRRSQQ